MRKFAIVIHNHQPIGNFDEVFIDAIQKAYIPFLETLIKFPKIKVGLHTSGCLFEFMEKKKINRYFDLVKELVNRGQVELISGGFYEPLLFLLPEEDRIFEIEMMNEYLLNKFNYNPKGLWLTERVWEPHLAKSIRKAGLIYTLIDDNGFRKIGIEGDDLFHYYITEEEGYTLNIFPILKTLRYMIPYHPVEEVISFLKGSSKVDEILVYGDDGEKFGLWPGTYEHVYNNGWLHRFFDALSREESVETVFPSDIISLYPPRKRVYIPPTSYEEMEEWALPYEKQKEFRNLKEKKIDRTLIGGGFFRNFLVKYEESNKMHKRMLFLREGISKNSNAYTHYLRSGCNCAYWHGIFGGLYLPHLRDAIYREIITAERESKRKSGFYIEDYNKDGVEEIIYRNERFMLFFDRRGGRLVELDDILLGKNLTNVMTRYRESYHSDIPKEENPHDTGVKTIHEIFRLKDKDALKYLKFDLYTKESFLDHHLNSIEEIGKNKPCLDMYDYEISKDRLLFKREGLSKEFVIGKDFIEVTVSMSKAANFYVMELNLSIPIEDVEVVERGTSIVVSKKDRLSIEVSREALFRFEPIYTVSNSPSGIEKIYQGISLFLVFPLREEYNKIKVKLGELK
ncbi:MAG TPA: DUF1926 domain-containing protein [Firmicutes bacterium]|nr:DUF1926 domain-containing protein [Bacillota bacterium]